MENNSNNINDIVLQQQHCYYRTTITSNDVLIGLNYEAMNHEGNIKLRHIVSFWKNECNNNNTTYDDDKCNSIIELIIYKVTYIRKGVFVRKVYNINDIKEKGYIPNDTEHAYVLADDRIINRLVRSMLISNVNWNKDYMDTARSILANQIKSNQL